MKCLFLHFLVHRLPLYLLFLFISLVFLIVNLVCALLVRMSSAETHIIVLVRVTINDSLFVLCAVSLSLCLYKIAKMSLANIYLESKVRNTLLFTQVTVASCLIEFTWVPCFVLIKTSFFIQLSVNLAGDVGVAGDSHRRHRHLPVHVQGLLQPGGPGTLQQQHQLL